MNFKKSKQEVANSAAIRAGSRIGSFLSCHNNGNLSGIGHNIEIAIADAIREAVLSIVEDVYTDVEFEEDLKLRDKF